MYNFYKMFNGNFFLIFFGVVCEEVYKQEEALLIILIAINFHSLPAERKKNQKDYFAQKSKYSKHIKNIYNIVTG